MFHSVLVSRLETCVYQNLVNFLYEIIKIWFSPITQETYIWETSLHIRIYKLRKDYQNCIPPTSPTLTNLQSSMSEGKGSVTIVCTFDHEKTTTCWDAKVAIFIKASILVLYSSSFIFHRVSLQNQDYSIRNIHQYLYFSKPNNSSVWRLLLKYKPRDAVIDFLSVRWPMLVQHGWAGLNFVRFICGRDEEKVAVDKRRA